MNYDLQSSRSKKSRSINNFKYEKLNRSQNDMMINLIIAKDRFIKQEQQEMNMTNGTGREFTGRSNKSLQKDQSFGMHKKNQSLDQFPVRRLKS